MSEYSEYRSVGAPYELQGSAEGKNPARAVASYRQSANSGNAVAMCRWVGDFSHTSTNKGVSTHVSTGRRGCCQLCRPAVSFRWVLLMIERSSAAAERRCATSNENLLPVAVLPAGVLL